MKLELGTETLTPKEIAERQLERALSLFFNEKDFVSALTLAGAAEEILGKMLNEAGRKNTLDEVVAGSMDLVGNETAKPNQIAALANHYRNRMKHLQDGSAMTFSVGFEAAEMIERATSNYWQLTHELSPLMERFQTEVMLRESSA